MTSEEYLKQIQKLDCLINNKLAEKERIFSIATNINQTLSGMPHNSGVSDKVGDGAVKLADMESEIDRMVDEYADKKGEVIHTIEQLPAMEYDVIHKHYIQGRAWEDVAQSAGYTLDNIFKIRTKALEHIDKMIALQ